MISVDVHITAHTNLNEQELITFEETVVFAPKFRDQKFTVEILFLIFFFFLIHVHLIANRIKILRWLDVVAG